MVEVAVERVCNSFGHITAGTAPTKASWLFSSDTTFFQSQVLLNSNSSEVRDKCFQVWSATEVIRM